MGEYFADCGTTLDVESGARENHVQRWNPWSYPDVSRSWCYCELPPLSRLSNAGPRG